MAQQINHRIVLTSEICDLLNVYAHLAKMDSEYISIDKRYLTRFFSSKDREGIERGIGGPMLLINHNTSDWLHKTYGGKYFVSLSDPTDTHLIDDSWELVADDRGALLLRFTPTYDIESYHLNDIGLLENK